VCSSKGGERGALADFFIWIAELSTKSAKVPPYACRQSKAAEALLSFKLLLEIQDQN
jgi:hypothetical protein